MEPTGYRELPCIFGPARRPFLGRKMKASEGASFFLLFTVLQTCAAPAAAADPPADIGRFVEPGTKLLSVHAADLNGDGTQDYLLVLQRGDTQGTRPLLIVGREKSGALKLLKRNEQVVGCAECGGMMGDPLQALEVKGQGFTVETAGGSVDRWSNSFTFTYSRKDKTWKLARAEVSTHAASDPDSVRTKVYLPRDFGAIDIARFDPYRYLHPTPAQTLCGEDETDHFSCTAKGSRKIISVCSNIKEGTIGEGSWLQYRFGKPGKIELAFPREKKASLAKFEGNYFNPREQPLEIADLRFAAPGALYSVALDRDGSKKEGEDGQYGGGVNVALGPEKRVAIGCGKVDGARYFDGFVELNRTLPQSDGKTDMLQRFYRDAAK